MKKMFTIIAVIVIIATLFAGCTTGNSSPDETTAPETKKSVQDYKEQIQPTLVHLYTEDFPNIKGYRMYYYDTANNNVVIYVDVNSHGYAGIGASGTLTDSITGKPIHLDEFLARRGITVE